MRSLPFSPCSLNTPSVPSGCSATQSCRWGVTLPLSLPHAQGQISRRDQTARAERDLEFSHICFPTTVCPFKPLSKARGHQTIARVYVRVWEQPLQRTARLEAPWEAACSPSVPLVQFRREQQGGASHVSRILVSQRRGSLANSLLIRVSVR